MEQETKNQKIPEIPEGRAVINKTVLRISAAALALAVGVMVWNKPTGNKGLYDNKPATFITTESGQKKNVSWVVNTGAFNQYACYGMGDYMSSSPTLVSNYILKLRRAGVKEVGFIYSKSSSVTGTLDFYQKRQESDSTKFTFVISEIEQYNTGDRAGFYKNIREVSNWCLKNGVKRAVYQGWPSQADMDSIVKYTDRLFLHAYGQYDKQGNVGSWVYGYSKGRINMAVVSMNKFYPGQDLKYSIQTILSCENPDQTKTQFGFKYFTTHTFEEPYSSFISYWNSHATTEQKRRVLLSGSMLFVGEQAKKIKK